MAKNINVILSLQDRFTTKMSQASVATLQFKRNLAIAQVASDKMATVMHKMETAAAVGVTAAATATTAAVKTSLDAYEEFNKSINNVAGVKGISTVSEEFKNLTEAAKEASKNVKGTTYKDAADSLYYMSLAGWNTTQSLNAIEPVLKAVRISGQDTKTVADALTDSMTALGLSSEQAAEYVDIATSVQSASNTDMLQLQNALIKSGAGMESLYRRYADTMGEAAGKMQAAKDTMAIVGALSSAGIKDSKAGTVINSLFTRFVKDSAEAQDGLESIGMSMYDNGKLKSTAKIFEEMSVKVASLNEQERNSALAKIGGRFRSQLETLINAFNTVGEDGQTAISKINKAMEYSEGAADRYINAINSGWSGTVAEMSAAWFNFRAEVGETIAPYAIKGMDYIIDKLPTLEKWLKTNLPPALEKGKEIVVEIKNTLEEFKPVMEWIVEHWKQIATVAGTAYVGMGAFRLGTAGVEAYDTLGKITKGIGKEKAAKAAVNIKSKKALDADSILGKGTAYSLSNIFSDNAITAWGNNTGKNLPTIGKMGALTDTDVLYKKGSKIPTAAVAQWYGSGLATEAIAGATTSETIGTVAAGSAGAAGSVGGTVGASVGSAGSALAGLAAPAAILAAIIVLFVGMWKSSEKFRESIKNIVGTVKDNAVKAFGGLKDSISKAKESAQPFFDVCGKIFGVLGDVAAIAINVLSPFVGAAVDLIGLGLGSVIEGIGYAFGLVGKAIERICNDPLVEFLKDCIDYLGDLSEEFREFIGLVTDDEPSKAGEYKPDAYTGTHSSVNGTITQQTNPSGGVSDEAEGGEGDSGGVKMVETADGWKGVPSSSSTIGDITITDKDKIRIRNSDAFTTDEKIEQTGMGPLQVKMNALGTNYWRGGITSVNERGGEIMDLPRGTRIIPADKSKKIADNGDKGITVIVNIENYYGEDEAYINRIGSEVGHRLAQVM